MSSTSVSANNQASGPEQAVACAHCGLDVPPGLLTDEADQFCCHGCEAAFHLLQDAGLGAFYDYRASEDPSSGAKASNSETYEEFDDPVFARDHIKVLGERTRRVDLVVEGLHCRACVWLLEQLPRLEPGVLESRLNMHRSKLTVTWDSSVVDLSQVAQLLGRLGYPPYPATEGQAQQLERIENRKRLIQIAIAAAIAGNLMIISVAVYAGWWSGMRVEVSQFFRWVSAGLGLLAVAIPGRSFFAQAWQGLRSRVPNMDLPIAVGLSLGTSVGLWNTVTGTGEIYFDSLAMLILLLLVGRWIQYRQHRRAANLIHQLYEMTPRRARRIEPDGGSRWVPVGALQVDDRVKLLAGEVIPADGIVSHGESAVDRSLLTGESIPVRVRDGDELFAGMTNVSAAIEVKVTAQGASSRLGKLIDMIEGAAIQRTPIVQLADRLGAYFVVAILVLTALTAAVWRLLQDPHYLDHAIALAIVACPCALGLATPLAVAVSIGRAARHKLLIKGGDTLERLSRPGTIWLDKTGTLTEGKLRLLSWVGDKSVRGAVVELEKHSSHPMATTLVEQLSKSSSSTDEGASPEAEQVQQSEVGGIAGVIAGEKIHVGNLGFLRSEGVHIEPQWLRWASWVGHHGSSPVLVARDARVVAGAAIGDRLRGDSQAVVSRLKKMGWTVGILSGDHPAVVSAVAKQLGIDDRSALGGLLPEGKLEKLRDADRDDETVVMVGDGMNDSVALAAADVGISMKSSAETSLETADVHLGRDGLEPLCQLLSGARQTVATIRWALIVSLAYNVIAVLLAALGWINPLMAAVIMPLSSLSVLSLALSGKAFRNEVAVPTQTEPLPAGVSTAVGGP